MIRLPGCPLLVLMFAGSNDKKADSKTKLAGQ